METNNGKSKTISALKIVFSLLGAIVFLFTAYHGLNSYLDHRIETHINNPDFLKRVAMTVRPSLIFDGKGSIIADMGAASLIDNISVLKDKKGNFEIIIKPIVFLGAEPALEALDFNYSITAERGQKFDWVFHLSGISYLITADSPPRPGLRERFRLEIIR